MPCLNLDFYGLKLEVSSDDRILLEEIEQDFLYFKSAEQTPHITISMELVSPNYEELPPLRAQFITPRNVCYRDGHLTYIDYSGKALCIHNREGGSCRIQGLDFNLVREICYLFILSVTGQYFDGEGLHRIHALGVSRNGKAALLLMPSGGGKSTMALRLLSEPNIKLLSDDSPLVDPSGSLHGFPLRVGIAPGGKSGIEPKYIRTLERMEFDPKTVISIEAFKNQLAEKAEPCFLLIGERNLGSVSQIKRMSKRRAFKALFNNMVVGLGLYQGLEFLLERASWEVLLKVGPGLSRLRNAYRLLRRSECYLFVIGRDVNRNAEKLLDFLNRRLPPPESEHVQTLD